MISRKAREQAIKRAGGACEMCGRRSLDLDVVHLVPLSGGGTDALGNLRALCRSCHVLAHRARVPTSALAHQAQRSRRFEELVVDVLREAGLAVLSGATGPDAGLDVVAYGTEPGTGRPISIMIECKSQARPINTAQVHCFAAKAKNYGSTYAIVVTDSRPTRPAKEAAERLGLSVLDVRELREFAYRLIGKASSA